MGVRLSLDYIWAALKQPFYFVSRSRSAGGISGAVSHNTASGNAVNGIDLREGIVSYNRTTKNGNVGISLGGGEPQPL